MLVKLRCVQKACFVNVTMVQILCEPGSSGDKLADDTVWDKTLEEVNCGGLAGRTPGPFHC